MAEMPKKITLSMRATPGSMERFNAAIAAAKNKVNELQEATWEAQEALKELEFVVDVSQDKDD